jgi:hypothetical protein
MVREKIPQETPDGKKDDDQLIPSEPGLNHIYKTLGLLDGYTEWKKSLPEKIGPWENSLDLFNNVQRAVMEQAQDKVLGFRDKIPALSGVSDQDIVDTIVNNWPETLDNKFPQIKEQRERILLDIAAHVVKHIETAAYQEVISKADEDELGKLGLNPELRDVATKVLDASMRADNLFIRFLAFSQLSPDLPKSTSRAKIYASRQDEERHTINELFPRDTQYLAKKFKEIADTNIDWENMPGGETFKEYLLALSDSYQESDVSEIRKKYIKVHQLYKESILTDFPILIIPTEYEWAYEIPGYHDPEIRIALRSPECVEKEKQLLPSQRVISEQLEKMGYPELAKNIIKKKIRVVNTIGDYGVNLQMKTTAQAGEQVIILYLGEQRKLQENLKKDKNFRIGNTAEPYSLEKSFLLTAFHEFCHFHKSTDPAVKRFGDGEGINIEEVKAEQFYRQFLPELINRGAIEGTEEEWASAALENSLEELMDKAKNDEYYLAATYTLNKLLEEGIVDFDLKTGIATIKNVARFFELNKELSKKVLRLYEDKGMTPEKADKWINDNCTTNKHTSRVSRFLKKEPLPFAELPENPETGSIKIFPWEPAWLKKGNPQSAKDVKTLKLTDRQPDVEKFMVGDPLKKSDFKDEGFYAVCGEKDVMEGFVWIYELADEVRINLGKSKLVGPNQLENVWEVSFARLIDKNISNEELKKKINHLMPSAVRQICSLFKESKEITIVAYSDPENLNSSGVLTNACFEKKGEVFYDKKSKKRGKKDNFWVLSKDKLNKLLLKEQEKFKTEMQG